MALTESQVTALRDAIRGAFANPGEPPWTNTAEMLAKIVAGLRATLDAHDAAITALSDRLDAVGDIHSSDDQRLSRLEEREEALRAELDDLWVHVRRLGYSEPPKAHESAPGWVSPGMAAPTTERQRFVNWILAALDRELYDAFTLEGSYPLLSFTTKGNDEPPQINITAWSREERPL